MSGLPSSLDGRLKSGSAVDRSHASIVLRQLRISGQTAPVDVNPIPRNGWIADQTGGFGGAFEYDGGSDDPENLVRIIFVEVVFDHNAASSLAGAVGVDGRAGHPSGSDPETQTWESGIELTIAGCTFFRTNSVKHFSWSCRLSDQRTYLRRQLRCLRWRGNDDFGYLAVSGAAPFASSPEGLTAAPQGGWRC